MFCKSSRYQLHSRVIAGAWGNAFDLVRLVEIIALAMFSKSVNYTNTVHVLMCTLWIPPNVIQDNFLEML
jgi:hypothetical protein